MLHPMQFVYPSFLLALAAIAIPIIIHLFHFRRYKKIVFSDIRFLKQVQEQNKSKQKIKDLLILLARMLAIVCLVLAFAQPFIPSQHSLALKGQKAVSVFVDNSFSMNSEGNEGILLETAKTKARAIVKAYGADDEFQILTHDMEGKHQRLVNKTDALLWIDEIKITPASAPLSSILKRQKQALEKAGNQTKLQYIVSDFQQQMCDVQNIPVDSSIILHLIPITANTQQNISVDSVWFANPVIQGNTPTLLKARIRNYGTEAVEAIAVKLNLNGQQKGLQNSNCPARSFVDITFPITPTGAALQQGSISLMDNPIIFDDKCYFSFSPITEYNVLSMNAAEPNTYITKLYASDPIYKLTQAAQNQLNYALFGKQQLIILNEPQTISSGLLQELTKYIEQGGQLLIVPPQTATTVGGINTLLSALQLPNYGLVLQQKLTVSSIQSQSGLFKNVFQRLPQNMDFPSVTQYYALQRNNTTKGKPVMELSNGQPFVWQATYKKGTVVLLSTPLNTAWSNLPQHSVYVPMMLNLGMGNSRAENVYYTIGRPQWIECTRIKSAEKLIRIWSTETELAFETSQRNGKTAFYLDQPLSKSGIYNIANQNAPKVEQLIAFNFDRTESDLQQWKIEDMKSFIGNWPNARLSTENTETLQNSIANDMYGTPFWRYCVWLTLVFVLIEILLLRLLK
jgi:hypothetical protein